MQNTLVKTWGPYGIGTVVADNAAEAKATPGAVHVNPDRFAKLHESGHLARAEPSRPIPAEVATSREGGSGRLYGRLLEDNGGIEETFAGTAEGTERGELAEGEGDPEDSSVDAAAEKEP